MYVCMYYIYLGSEVYLHYIYLPIKYFVKIFYLREISLQTPESAGLYNAYRLMNLNDDIS